MKSGAREYMPRERTKMPAFTNPTFHSSSFASNMNQLFDYFTGRGMGSEPPAGSHTKLK